MRALIYLWAHSFYNGIKRAITSPRRLIGLIFFLGYYYLLIIRPVTTGQSPSGRRLRGNLGAELANMHFPAVPVLDSIVFGVFVLFSIFLSMSLMGYRAGFKQADVDVLFATPVSPKLVMGFRLIRDYLLTMIAPLIIGVFALSSLLPIIAQFMSKDPAAASNLYKAVAMSWFLTAISWVSVGYAVSLFVGRSDEQSDRNARIIGWSIAVAIIGSLAFAVLRFRADPTFESLQSIAHSPIIRAVYFIPTAATSLAMAPLNNAWIPGISGGLALVSIISVGVWAALSQVGWLYDQASVKGFKNAGIREMQKKGDTAGMYAEYARMGKIKRGRIAAWISAKTFKGPSSIIYKELLLFFRTQIASTVLFVVIVGVIGPFMLWAVPDIREIKYVGLFYLGVTGMMLLITALSLSQTNYVETLRRVDLTKPLPFTPAKTVFYEVTAKALPPMLVSLVPFLVGFCIRPKLWDYHLTGLFLGPSFMLLTASLSFLVIVLFPDVEDPTQRGFRGMIMMLGLLMVAIPATGLIVGAVALNIPLSPVALVGAGINFGLSLVLATIAGGLFADFNPSE